MSSTAQPGRHDHTAGKLSRAAYADLGMHHARLSPYEHAQSPARGSAGRGRMKYAHDNSHLEGPWRPVRTASQKRLRPVGRCPSSLACWRIPDLNVCHRADRRTGPPAHVSRANRIGRDVRPHWDAIDDPNAAIQRMQPPRRPVGHGSAAGSRGRQPQQSSVSARSRRSQQPTVETGPTLVRSSL